MTLTAFTTDVVVGCGALGVALAYDLHKNCATSPGKIAVSSRRAAALPLRFLFPAKVLEAENAVSFSPSFVWKSGFWPLPNSVGPVRFFLCVPPEATDAALSEVRVWAEGAAASQVQVILCGNGLGGEEPELPRLMQLPSVARIERALFFCGFEFVSRNQEGTTSRHRGGNDVAHAPLFARENTQFIEPHGWLHWRQVDNARTLELEKFFVNLVLAGYIGSQSIPNGRLREKLSEHAAEILARAFTCSVAPEILPTSQLLHVLWTTVATTASNINSVSLAGSRGHGDTFRHLLGQARLLLSKSLAPKSSVVDFENFLQEAETLWKRIG